jgi:exosome complex component RRP4
MNKIQDREIVIPGQLLGEGIRCETLGESCAREGSNTYALVKGLARVVDNNTVNVVPIHGAYLPKPGDMVVGVIDYDLGGIFTVDIRGAYRCILKPRSQNPRGGDRGRGRGGRDQRGRDEEEAETFNVGDLVSSKIATVDEVKEAQLTGTWKLEPGYVIHVNPKRVPRIIGKKKSMIDMIRQYTGSRITVGQNGLIWIKDGNVPLAVEAIRKVEAEAQSTGLTDRVADFLKSRSK